MNGEGFRVFVESGQTVEQGQKVMEADITKIRECGYDPMVVVLRIS